MMNDQQARTAEIAQEYSHNLGRPDLNLSFEQSEYEADADAEDIEPCVYCGHPVAVEPLDVPLCDGCEQAEAEGRAEMYEMLEITGY